MADPVTLKSRGATLGQATLLDNQYQTSGLMYPDDLMQETNNPYGKNYVIFYINVHEDSILVKEKMRSYVDGNIPERVRGEVAGKKFDPTAMEGMAIATGAATVAGAGIAQRVSGAVGAPLKAAAATVTNYATGALAASALVDKLGRPGAEYKRQQKAIALYVPNDMSIGYAARWSETTLAGASAIASTLDSMSKYAKNSGTSISGMVGNIADSVKGYGASLAIQTPGVGQMMAKTTGTAANPKREQLFQQVDYRTFTFTYQFFPRSEKEAEDVLNIIREFKLHMHPEYRPGSDQFLYIYPSEFDIYYYNNGKENMNLHRHTSCVLENVQVSYTPNGVFATFENGMPAQINMTLQFKELALLTKETILDGY